MLPILLCLAGVFAILLIAERLSQKKILRGDLQRQFVHITVGSFIAFWPWIISFNAIALIGIAMLAFLILNYRLKLADFYSGVSRRTYGDVFYALAIVSSALLTDEKIFFALAILIMAVGDGLANVVGQRYGKRWRYKVLGHSKTFYGSMVMWFASLCILGVGLLFVHDLVNYSTYTILLLAVPPVLVIVENAAVWGLDNLAVPLITLLALNLAK